MDLKRTIEAWRLPETRLGSTLGLTRRLPEDVSSGIGLWELTKRRILSEWQTVNTRRCGDLFSAVWISRDLETATTYRTSLPDERPQRQAMISGGDTRFRFFFLHKGGNCADPLTVSGTISIWSLPYSHRSEVDIFLQHARQDGKSCTWPI